MNKSLQLALAKLISEGVSVIIHESSKGDQFITIQTESCKVVLGANDLGVWLVESKKRKKFAG